MKKIISLLLIGILSLVLLGCADQEKNNDDSVLPEEPNTPGDVNTPEDEEPIIDLGEEISLTQEQVRAFLSKLTLGDNKVEKMMGNMKSSVGNEDDIELTMVIKGKTYSNFTSQKRKEKIEYNYSTPEQENIFYGKTDIYYDNDKKYVDMNIVSEGDIMKGKFDITKDEGYLKQSVFIKIPMISWYGSLKELDFAYLVGRYEGIKFYKNGTNISMKLEINNELIAENVDLLNEIVKEEGIKTLHLSGKEIKKILLESKNLDVSITVLMKNNELDKVLLHLSGEYLEGKLSRIAEVDVILTYIDKMPEFPDFSEYGTYEKEQ